MWGGLWVTKNPRLGAHNKNVPSPEDRGFHAQQHVPWLNSKGCFFFFLRLGLFTYSWSLLLTVIWFGFSYLRLKVGLVFLLTVPPIQKLGLVFSACSPVRKLVLFFITYGSPTVRKKTNCKQKDLNCKYKRRIHFQRSRRLPENHGFSCGFACGFFCVCFLGNALEIPSAQKLSQAGFLLSTMIYNHVMRCRTRKIVP